MYRADELNFRIDVYGYLLKQANFKVAGVLSVERKIRNDDSLFFDELLFHNDSIIEKASIRGKRTESYTCSFIDTFKKVINDNLAYKIYLYQNELSDYKDSLLNSISKLDTRINNSFNTYWREKCSKSLSGLYYLSSTIDTPKYENLGFDASQILFYTIQNNIKDIEQYLNNRVIEEKDVTQLSADDTSMPTSVNQNTSDTEHSNNNHHVTQNDLAFLNYAFESIASIEYLRGAQLINSVRKNYPSEIHFWDEFLNNNIVFTSRGDNKHVTALCNLMQSIFNNEKSRTIYENKERYEKYASFIRDRIYDQDATIHSLYKRLIKKEDTIASFYIRIMGLYNSIGSLPRVDVDKSKIFIQIYTGIISAIDVMISKENNTGSVDLFSKLYKLHFKEAMINKIIEIKQRCGHFPCFTFISYLLSLLNGNELEVTNRSLNIRNDHPIEDLSDIAVSLGLTRERVRQLRDSGYRLVLAFPEAVINSGLYDNYHYTPKSEYDFRLIREEEDVDLSNEYITICLSLFDTTFTLIGDIKKALYKKTDNSLFLVPTNLNKQFNFSTFIEKINDMVEEKRLYPYREELDAIVRKLIKKHIKDEVFYEILKECRKILEKGYPDIIINSQIYLPANTRKTIPYLIEDILREFNRPMNAEEICEQLNLSYPELHQVPSKIGPNALRNNNIVAVSRSSTYALTEWDDTINRGGTIRDLAIEYLNSLIQPIATLSDIHEYINKYRQNIKESSLKSNLLAEANNKFSVYTKDNLIYIGFTDYDFGGDFVRQEKRQSRRSFKDSINIFEQFIKEKGHFPYSVGEEEEQRLFRFYVVSKEKKSKGLLSEKEISEIDRIESMYGHLKTKKERINWEERLERFVKYITENDTLPIPSSQEYKWYIENKELFDNNLLDANRMSSFSLLIKIVERMNK